MKRKHRNEKKSKSLSLSLDKVKQESKVKGTKPCEVCGSVGIEKSMMICFKCRDTREHPYCARVKLPSVPPIWLCEECRSSSRVVVISNVAEDRLETETSLADCSSDPKKSKSSREEDHETGKLRNNDMEDIVPTRISLPVLEASISDSNHEISASVSSAIHQPLQPHTRIAREASSVPNDTQQHQVSHTFPKKRRTFRLTGKHLSQPHHSRIKL